MVCSKVEFTITDKDIQAGLINPSFCYLNHKIKTRLSLLPLLADVTLFENRVLTGKKK
jgi:hypothetical protein